MQVKTFSSNGGSWGSWTNTQPQTGVWSPEWSIDSRFSGDIYVDTDTNITYTNPNSSGNTGWLLMQVTPA